MQVLLDIGAGNGYFSLAAAALGHRALAFEVAPKSVASFNASMSHNGFEHLVTLNQARNPLLRPTHLTPCQQSRDICKS